MSDSTENTNELDSYGVWVKNTPGEDTPAQNETDTSDSFDFASSLDLPDFDALDTSDTSELDNLFADDSIEPVAAEEENPLTQNDDTTLNPDELMNITNSADFIETEAQEPSEEDSELSLDSNFSLDSDVTDFDLSLDNNTEPSSEPDLSLDTDLLSDTDLNLDSEASLDSDLNLDSDLSLDSDLNLDTDLNLDSDLSLDSDLNLDSAEISDDFNFAEVEETETSEVPVEESISDDFSFDNSETETAEIEESNFGDIFEQTVETEENTEPSIDSFDSITEPAVEDTINFDSFETEATESVETPDEETTEESEEISLDAFDFETESTEETVSDSDESLADEEISLDDFMDEGFSDESVAAGNNGYEPGANPSESSGSSEEVSLDDFLDGGFESEKEKQQEEVVDEKPLEMNLSFDDSAETVETEDNFSIDSENDYDDEIESAYAEEEITSSVDIPEEEIHITSTDTFDSEEIDLSDFGIDATAEETPVTQDIEGSKIKEEVVDYDLRVENDSAAAAPIVNEIKSSDVTEDTIESASANDNVTTIETSVLQQIVNDLSSLKDEINSLKSNLSDMKNKEPVIQAEDDFIIEETKDEGGFFSNDDEDDTIALSNDELNNIMNTTSVITADAEPQTDDFTEVEADEPVIVEEAPFEETETSISDEELSLTEDSSMDFESEALEEPEIDANSILDGSIEIDSSIQDDDLPQEIEIEKDDLLVESSSTDFMESIPVATEPTITDETMESNPLEDFVTPSDEELETIDSQDSTETFTDVFTEGASDSQEPSFDSIISESDAPVIEETAVEEETFGTVEDDFASFGIASEPVSQPAPVVPAIDPTDNLFVTEDTKSELTDSNINYLTSDDAIPEEMARNEENAELKKDIKSVLLYMDQLLENLPEDKIVEFAKSDEFATYKKLFSELGLS